jgi:hypothetical protein
MRERGTEKSDTGDKRGDRIEVQRDVSNVIGEGEVMIASCMSASYISVNL